MKIAYVANYQGPSLVKNRPCLHNFSLAARVKIQLIAELLHQSAHQVDIISQGALEPLRGADRFKMRFYPRYDEVERFHPAIPIQYGSALSVKYLIGFWESAQAQRLLKAGHRRSPYDAVIIYNLQRAQLGCARYAIHELGLPVILQYEDDSFVDVHGNASHGIAERYRRHRCRTVLQAISGATAVSPYLLAQCPGDKPQLLLRGVVSGEILKLKQNPPARKDWVVFSGTHEGTQGLEQTVEAWRMLRPAGWELHVAGRGPITAALEAKASGDPSIVFHGLLDRAENARLLCAARIGMNAQDLTSTPGNVFAFKIVEYLAAGLHVVTTPRGALEPELEQGISYIPGNDPATIAESLKQLIAQRRYERTAEEAAVRTYGPKAVSEALNNMLEQVTARNRTAPSRPRQSGIAPAPSN
jgi:glycosyltransferase involved in cell wall biosynthesis